MGGGTDGVGWPWTVVVRFIPSKLGEVELAREAGHACVAVSYLPCRESKGGKGGVGSSWLSCIARLQAPVAPKRTPKQIPHSWTLGFHAFFPNPARSTLRPTLLPSETQPWFKE